MPCNCLFMLYNKLGERKNCQTHRSYVICSVESAGVISFSVTRIFKQSENSMFFLLIIILWCNAIIPIFTFSLCLLVYPWALMG